MAKKSNRGLIIVIIIALVAIGFCRQSEITKKQKSHQPKQKTSKPVASPKAKATPRPSLKPKAPEAPISSPSATASAVPTNTSSPTHTTAPTLTPAPSGSSSPRESPAASNPPAALATALPAAAEAPKPATYTLKFSPAFNPGDNYVDDLGLSIVIAVDCSKSMAEAPASGGEAKYLQTRATLLRVLDYAQSLQGAKAMSGMKLKLGIIAFDSELREVFPLREMGAAAYREARASLANSEKSLEPGGKTAIGLALERGTELLAQSGTVLKTLVVITDGENTVGPDPLSALNAINEDRNSASRPGLPVRTAGTLVRCVGFDVQGGLFAAWEAEGARVYETKDRPELEKALRGLIAADISRLEAKP
jgi:Mg-chelatase subunit ChlD